MGRREFISQNPVFVAGLGMLALAAAGFLDAYFTQWVAVYSPSEGHSDGFVFAVVSAIMGMAAFLTGLEELSRYREKRNPVEIIVSHNTLIASWGSQSDVMLGTRFSSEQELVSKSQALVDAIDQAAKTLLAKKGGWFSRPYIVLYPDKSVVNGESLSEAQWLLLGNVIKRTKYRRGIAFPKSRETYEAELATREQSASRKACENF